MHGKELGRHMLKYIHIEQRPDNENLLSGSYDVACKDEF